MAWCPGCYPPRPGLVAAYTGWPGAGVLSRCVRCAFGMKRLGPGLGQNEWPAASAPLYFYWQELSLVLAAHSRPRCHEHSDRCAAVPRKWNRRELRRGRYADSSWATRSPRWQLAYRME